jgi:hypothetical protein
MKVICPLSKSWSCSSVLGTSRTTISILVGLFLVGCSASATAPVVATLNAKQTLLPAVLETETAKRSTATATASGSEPPVSSNAGEILNRAVTNLLNATSFEVSVYDVRAYQIIHPNGETSLVYGEFSAVYEVIRLPALKVHGSHEYRYDPQADFQEYDSYTYQEDGKYLSRIVDISSPGDEMEIDPGQIEPIAGDVYSTMVNYSDQAEFIRESDGIAVYILEHPEWYTLQGAIGFADLGYLYMQEDGEQLVEQYVAEHYRDVKTILFTIYVAVDEQLITKVEVNDRDFMVSVWEEVDRALIEAGEKPETLTRYEVMDVNGAEYLFNNYNQIQDIEIP